MREKLIYGLGAIAAVLLARDLYSIFMQLPDEASQGMIYRIIFFHVPAAITAMLCAGVTFVTSAAYLLTKSLRYDAISVAVTEVGLAFLAANLVTGSIWGRIIWGIWWTWDARLTSALVCWLLYAGYLMLRRAIEEPTARAHLGRLQHLRFRRRPHRHLLHQVVAHPASAARLLGRRQHRSGHVPDRSAQPRRAHSIGRRAVADPPPPGGSTARNRFPSPLRPRYLTDIKWTHAISHSCFTASWPLG